MMLPRHYECSATLSAPARAVFDYLDDHSQLSSHMSESSWMMGNGKMNIEADDAGGRRICSVICLSGRICGQNLEVTERVVEREPPHRKVWQTIGSPRLLIVGHYRMGFDIAPLPGGSMLSVFIDYALPDSGPGRALGKLLCNFYARWCTQQIVKGAARHFAAPSTHLPQAIPEFSGSARHLSNIRDEIRLPFDESQCVPLIRRHVPT